MNQNAGPAQISYSGKVRVLYCTFYTDFTTTAVVRLQCAPSPVFWEKALWFLYNVKSRIQVTLIVHIWIKSDCKKVFTLGYFVISG